MLSPSLGVYEKGHIVQYLLSGLPMYAHNDDDIESFRFITSNCIHQGLCRKIDIERCFGVTEASVQRWYNVFLKEGERGFFGNDNRKGVASKLVGARLQRIQSKLDKGQSVNSIANEEGVLEGTIRYSIKQGYLKKK